MYILLQTDAYRRIRSTAFNVEIKGFVVLFNPFFHQDSGYYFLNANKGITKAAVR